MRRARLLLALLAAGGCWPRQVRGTRCDLPVPVIEVKDDQTGSPICDATITVSDAGTVVVTPWLSADDPSACVYFFENADIGTYTVTVARQGYRSTTFSLTVEVGDCGQQTVGVSLTPTQ